MIYFLITSGIFFTVFGSVVIWRIVQIRVGGINTSHPATVREVFEPLLRMLVARAVVHGKKWGRSISYHVLVFGREVILFFKYVINRLEKKFSKTIDLVKGKGVHHGQTSSSFFLNEIKKHQDQMRGTMGVE